MSQDPRTLLNFLYYITTRDILGYRPLTPVLLNSLRDGDVDSLNLSHLVNRDIFTKDVEEILQDPTAYVADRTSLYRINDDNTIVKYERGQQWSPPLMDIPPVIVSLFPDREEEFHYAILVVNDKYLCGFDGKCELSLAANAVSLQECQTTCESVVQKDMVYNILSYDFSSYEELTPKDRQRVLREVIGKTLSPLKTNRILKLLSDDDWTAMRKEKDLEDYLSSRYTPYYIFLRDVTTAIGVTPYFDERILTPMLDEVIDTYGELPEASDTYGDDVENEEDEYHEEFHQLSTAICKFFYQADRDECLEIWRMYKQHYPMLAEYREERKGSE